jgi:hypothetical protein
VPKAPVNEDRELTTGEYDIRSDCDVACADAQALAEAEPAAV